MIINKFTINIIWNLTGKIKTWKNHVKTGKSLEGLKFSNNNYSKYNTSREKKLHAYPIRGLNYLPLIIFNNNW